MPVVKIPLKHESQLPKRKNKKDEEEMVRKTGWLLKNNCCPRMPTLFQEAAAHHNH